MVRVAAMAVAQVEGKAGGRPYFLCLKKKATYNPCQLLRLWGSGGFFF